MEPASGKARPGRSRAACSQCRAVKQKCDGSARGGDCKRCQIYGLACDFEGVATNPSRSHSSPAPANAALSASAAPAAPSSAPIRPSNFIPPTLKQTDPSVAAALREITERLRQIETGLEADRRRVGSHQHYTSSGPAQHSFTSAESSSPGFRSTAEAYRSFSQSNASNNHHVEMPAESNPLQVLEATIEKIEAMGVGESPPDWRGEDADGQDGQGGKEKEPVGPAPPDAIVRGLVSIADCEAAFAFFHERIQPWISIMGNPDDRVPLLVQARSPFLFHCILLVTNYYNTSTSDRAREVYRGLTEIVNTLLAWQILAPDPAQTTTDLVRGMVLLLYYKPVQHSALQARGITEPGRVVHLSKVNALSSMMLHGLIHRTAELVGLPRAPDNFLAAVTSPTPPTTQILSDLRVHYWLCIADIHGSLQSGRASATDPTSALQTTRLFASLKQQPCDPRRAAMLELYAIVRTPKGAKNATKIRLDNLVKINEELDAWEEYWTPILAESQGNGDPLAYSVVSNFLQFVTFTVNSSVFTRWTIERQKSLDEGGVGRPKLSEQDWTHLQRAVDAAQKTIFAVSVESTADQTPLRGTRWPENVTPYNRPPLTLDMKTVEDYRTALDTMTCISFISALIFLVRTTSAGISSCEIQCKRIDYESGAGIHVPAPLRDGSKLPRLLELGAQFLFAVAPNRYHPARKHSVLLQMIREAGLGAETPHSAGSGTTPSTVDLTSAAPRLPPVPASLPPLPTLPSQSQPTSQRQDSNGGGSPGDSWMWSAGAGLPVSLDGGSLLIPSAPEAQASEQGSSSMASILSSGDNPFFGNFYSTQASEIPGLTDDLGFSAMLDPMDWGMESGTAW